jgi:multidrug transporter EmrE-like cation transporter
MANFRYSQDNAHRSKSNLLLSAIIVLLILNITFQLWFLFGALNNALQDNLEFAIYTAIGSIVMAVFSFWILNYLPDPHKSASKK